MDQTHGDNCAVALFHFALDELELVDFGIVLPAGARGIRLVHTPPSSAAESTADGRGQQHWQ
jgi:hypothetical protein